MDVNVSSDLSGILYLGPSKYSMLKEYIGVFSVNKYTFTITGLPDETKVYFYIKNTSVGEEARTGIYKHYHVGGWVPILIDIGLAAINRNSYLPASTIFNLGNPANASGKITSVEIWAYTGLTGVKVATFYEVSGSYYSTRDYEVIGNVTSGSKQTFTVDLDVVEGDFLGMYYDGYMEVSTTGQAGVRSLLGDYIPCTNESFGIYTTHGASLYGTGETIE